jgi:transglutaminase-like putative cysteine protease
MRLSIRHETVYRFETAASGVIQTLRMTPRNYEGQHVVRWRLDVDRNCRLRQSEDAFGNHTHVFAVEGAIDELRVLVEGEIDVQDFGGIVRGTPERFPPALYLRETPLTAPDLDIAAYAKDAAREAGADTLSALHALLATIHEDMEFEPKPHVEASTTATEVLQVKRGGCEDLTHVFLVAARQLGVPARYVSGYFLDEEDPGPQQACHGWAEAYVPDLGWIGFDSSYGMCATEAHVRVAIGLDYLGAAPVRGARYGGSGEKLDVTVMVENVPGGRAYRRF